MSNEQHPFDVDPLMIGVQIKEVSTGRYCITAGCAFIIHHARGFVSSVLTAQNGEASHGWCITLPRGTRARIVPAAKQRWQ